MDQKDLQELTPEQRRHLELLAQLSPEARARIIGEAEGMVKAAAMMGSEQKPA